MENFIVLPVVASSLMHSLLAVGHCSLTCKQDWVAWHCSLVWITVTLWKKHSNLDWTDEHVLLNIVRGFAIGFLGGHCDAPWCIILHRCLDRRSYTEQHGSCYFRGYEWCSSCRSREEARCPSRWANYISLSLTLPYLSGRVQTRSTLYPKCLTASFAILRLCPVITFLLYLWGHC